MTGNLAAADRDEILNQLGRAARLLDRRSWADLDQVFSSEVTFDYGDGRGLRSGLVALGEQFRAFLDPCGGTQHLLGSVIVTATPSGATTQAYVQARHLGVGEMAGEVVDTNGEYVDNWARQAEGWRVTHRQATWSIVSGNAAILGF